MSDLYVREFGRGPIVVVLHATLVPAETYLPLAQRLATRYRVLLFDMPGYGRSPDPVDASFDATDRVLANALRTHAASELHAIVGYSSGAYRALDLVLRCGVRARVLALVGGLAHLEFAARQGFGALADTIEREPSLLRGPLKDSLAAANLSDSWRSKHPEDTEQIGAWLRQARLPAFVRELRAIAALPDLRDQLPRLQSRVYLRVGEADLTTPPSYSHDIAARVAGSRIDVVVERGHALFLEDVEATNFAIERALEM